MSDFPLNNSRTTMNINIDIRFLYFRVSVIRDSAEG